MRQRPHFFRQLPIAQFARTLPEGWAPITLICAGTGFVLAHVGAFGTSAVPAVVRFPYFVGLCLAAAVPAALLTGPGHEWQFGRLPEPARLLLLAAILTLLITPLVWVAAAMALKGDSSPARLLPLAGQVGPIATLVLVVMRFVVAPIKQEEKPPPPTNRSSLLRRLPPELRAAGVSAINAEDHYLRVHTPMGTALILMRFADALQAVQSLDGAQTHRSWWVARDAVLAAKRTDGRATLRLSSGIEVPVSRTHARRLRGLGWF